MTFHDTENLVEFESSNSETVPKAFYPSIKSIIKLFFLLLLAMVISGIVSGIIWVSIEGYKPKSSTLSALFNLLAYLASFWFVIRYALKRSQKQNGRKITIEFNQIQPWLPPLIILAALALVLPLSIMSQLIPMPKSVEKFFENLFNTNLISIIFIVIAAPILEEVLCRGIILKGLLKNYSPTIAVPVSALFFAIIHMNPWQAIPAFASGLFLGWIYYKTNSVIPCMIIHATNNTAAALLLFLPKKQQDFSVLFGKIGLLGACAISLFIFVAVWIFINKNVSQILKPIFSKKL